jgi:hypothetical protein
MKGAVASMTIRPEEKKRKEVETRKREHEEQAPSTNRARINLKVRH